MDFIISSEAKLDQKMHRILHLEDSKLDADLVARHLDGMKQNRTLDRVSCCADYLLSLETREYDLILADYSVPGFDDMDALKLAREYAPDTPFIFVSGALGEDLAVEALRLGAADFVLKQRLQRLPAAVSRAIEEARCQSA